MRHSGLPLNTWAHKCDILIKGHVSNRDWSIQVKATCQTDAVSAVMHPLWQTALTFGPRFLLIQPTHISHLKKMRQQDGERMCSLCAEDKG